MLRIVPKVESVLWRRLDGLGAAVTARYGSASKLGLIAGSSPNKALPPSGEFEREAAQGANLAPFRGRICGEIAEIGFNTSNWEGRYVQSRDAWVERH